MNGTCEGMNFSPN